MDDARPIEEAKSAVSHAALPIGQILLQHDFITADDLERGLAFQSRFGGRIGAVLVRMGALSESDLLIGLSEQLGLPILGRGDIPTDPHTMHAAIELSGQSIDWWLDQEAVVWDDALAGTVHCVARDLLLPSLGEAVDSCLASHRKVQWWLVRNQDLDLLLDTLVRGVAEGQRNVSDEVGHLRELAEEAPVVELVSNALSQSFNERASDIHIEPDERRFRIRYRIDGVLHTRLTLPRDRFDAIASRVKLLAGMDIAERRLPQDGRMTQRLNGQDVDIRVSALPGTWGESLVLRLLPKQRQQLHLAALGMEPDHRALFDGVIQVPNGIILVSGPTGSGKSTTLYAALETVNNGSNKIITVEDPVEYDIEGVNQVQAHSEIGYTFSRALRSILRQDPDVIMVGEIRDLETAQIAAQAALTGHLVFSTIHTNDAVSVFTRLIDMGLEPFLIASVLRTALAQRLVRRLCERCAKPAETPAESVIQELLEGVPDYPVSTARWRVAAGCADCHNTGYKGRLGIYEMVCVTEPLQRAILERVPAHEATEIARREGFRSLRHDALIKAANGLTSLDEVARATGVNIQE